MPGPSSSSLARGTYHSKLAPPVRCMHSPVDAVAWSALMQLIGSASCCACADHFKLSVFVTGLAVIVWKHVDPDVLSCPSEPALRLRDKHQIVCIRDLPVSAPTCLRWVMPGQAAELLRPQLDRSESTRDRMLHGLRPFSNPYTYTSSDSHYWSSWTCRPMRVVCPGGRLKVAATSAKCHGHRHTVQACTVWSFLPVRHPDS